MGGRRSTGDSLRSGSFQPFESPPLRRSITGNDLQQGHLRLLRVVPDLRVQEDGRTAPIRQTVETEFPLHDPPGGLRGEERTDRKPAVLRPNTTVQQQQLASQSADLQRAFRILRCQDEMFAPGRRRRLPNRGFDAGEAGSPARSIPCHGSARLPWQDSPTAAQLITLFSERAG